MLAKSVSLPQQKGTSVCFILVDATAGIEIYPLPLIPLIFQYFLFSALCHTLLFTLKSLQQ